MTKTRIPFLMAGVPRVSLRGQFNRLQTRMPTTTMKITTIKARMG
jgi:hypothetical protein